MSYLNNWKKIYWDKRNFRENDEWINRNYLDELFSFGASRLLKAESYNLDYRNRRNNFCIKFQGDGSSNGEMCKRWYVMLCLRGGIC